jgi:membrane protease YdiL (CAAX protease family)
MRRYSRLLTAFATIALGSLLVMAGWRARDVAEEPEVGPDPLRRYDALIARESVDEALRPATLREADRFLTAARSAPGGRAGVGARRAIIRGEDHRWSEAKPDAAHASPLFERLACCAYGTCGATCAPLFSADAASKTVADARAQAGLWSGSRICLVASWNAHLPEAHRKLLADTQTLLARTTRWERRASMLVLGSVIAGVVAVLSLRRRRSPAPPAPFVAPWTARALYAALIRCALYAALGALVVGLAVRFVRPQLVGAAATASLYLLLLGLVARLGFRRFGLAPGDMVRARPVAAPPSELALAALAAFGFDQGGRAAIGLLSLVTDVAPKWSDSPFLSHASPAALAIELTAIVVLAPLGEELVFRRVVFAFLATRWGAARALVAVSLAFGLLHFYSPVGTFMIAWAGMVYGWALYRTGSLWPGVAAHAAGNALAVMASIG